MGDKKLNAVSTASDGAYVYAEDANGNQIKISKADLATVVAGSGYTKITLQANESYCITDNTTLCYGLWIVKEIKSVGAIVLYLSEPKNGLVLGQVNNTDGMIAITASFNTSKKLYEVTITNNATVEREFWWKRIA